MCELCVNNLLSIYILSMYSLIKVYNCLFRLCQSHISNTLDSIIQFIISYINVFTIDILHRHKLVTHRRDKCYTKFDLKYSIIPAAFSGLFNNYPSMAQYSSQTRSTTHLLMPRLLVVPCHQQAQY